MSHPDVYVVLKTNDSYGEKTGTPLCVELDEQTAHFRKIGECVRYVPRAQILEEVAAHCEQTAAALRAQARQTDTTFVATLVTMARAHEQDAQAIRAMIAK